MGFLQAVNYNRGLNKQRKSKPYGVQPKAVIQQKKQHSYVFLCYISRFFISIWFDSIILHNLTVFSFFFFSHLSISIASERTCSSNHSNQYQYGYKLRCHWSRVEQSICVKCRIDGRRARSTRSQRCLYAWNTRWKIILKIKKKQIIQRFYAFVLIFRPE